MKLTKSNRVNYLLSINNINTYRDVLKNYPYKYLNLTPSDENNLKDKQKIVIYGKITSLIEELGEDTDKILSFIITSKSGRVFHVLVYNRNYFNNDKVKEKEIIVHGTYNLKKNIIEVINIYCAENTSVFRPIYHSIPGISAQTYTLLIKKSFEFYEYRIEEILPKFICHKYSFIERRKAIENIHFPKNKKDIKEALKYLKYEEAFCFILSNYIKRKFKKNDGVKHYIKIRHNDMLFFLKTLPFKLTYDQLKCVNEILKDMNKSVKMYRLLQGDVGSGKTIVAACALYANFIRKKQGVLMAPTESLAVQHYNKMNGLFSKFNINVCLLIGGLSKAKKECIYQDIYNNKVDIIIGTHSVINDEIRYSNLGLFIIDEQQRFGVKQRKSLLFNQKSVDLLMLSATPIPRTLALGIFGNIDVSSIKEFPCKNKKIVTKIVKSYDKKIFESIDNCLFDGRQIYVVVPKINSDKLSDFSIQNLTLLYKQKYKEKVGILTGKMKNFDKIKILEKFYNHEYSILLSTTAIEVGIDVKNASLLIVYGANYFGLSTLHQLRGRIGRDGHKSLCYLVYDGMDFDTLNRLKILEESNDGFLLSNYDLKVRGEGEIEGIKQSGKISFSILNLSKDFRIFELAQKDAKQILKNRNDPENMKILRYIVLLLKQKKH